jgi:pimeloyl-ACP methyl ester carboxylesterase
MFRFRLQNLKSVALTVLLISGALPASGHAAPGIARAGLGDAIPLQAQGLAFESLYLETPLKNVHGGVVLVRGRDPKDLFLFLYKGLPARGWRVLYLLSPFSENAEESAIPLAETAARIEAAVAWLKEKPSARIVLAGQGEGVRAVARYLAKTPDQAVEAAVFVDAPEDGESGLLEDIGKIGVPLLDIQGERGKNLATSAARARETAARNNRSYRQTLLADPSMTLEELQGWLLNRIHGWLRRLSASGGQ